MKKPRFEIGCLYKKKGNSRIFLAITRSKLLSAKKGKLAKTTPKVQYKYRNDLTFEDLCENWGISEKRLDEISKEFMPSPSVTRARPMGTRRRKAADEFFWRELRLTRISLSA